jgi:predicted RNA binding protein YcfA (HicA-like mRNA interferase family)
VTGNKWVPLHELRRHVANRAVKELLRRVDKLGGWSGRLTRGGHVQLRHDGTRAIVTLSSTPGEHRSLKNTEAYVRRIEKGSQG